MTRLDGHYSFAHGSPQHEAHQGGGRALSSVRLSMVSGRPRTMVFQSGGLSVGNSNGERVHENVPPNPGRGDATVDGPGSPDWQSLS